jgi:short-subunit dehydrogenase
MPQGTQSIIWISGATSGIGAALARACPYEDAQIINLSRSRHRDLESVTLDLCDPSTWSATIDDFNRRLAHFAGRRAIFIHNGFFQRRSLVGKGEAKEQLGEVMANVAAPLVLGDAFLRAAGPALEAGVEVGLLQMSSEAAGLVYPGMAVYSAGKSSMEQWVRIARAEVATAPRRPWIFAARPGLVDTPAAHKDAAMPIEQLPCAPDIAAALASGQDVQDADDLAHAMWAALPPRGDDAIQWFGKAIIDSWRSPNSAG